jgi:hypothetical protein
MGAQAMLAPPRSPPRVTKTIDAKRKDCERMTKPFDAKRKDCERIDRELKRYGLRSWQPSVPGQ